MSKTLFAPYLDEDGEPDINAAIEAVQHELGLYDATAVMPLVLRMAQTGLQVNAEAPDESKVLVRVEVDNGLNQYEAESFIAMVLRAGASSDQHRGQMFKGFPHMRSHGVQVIRKGTDALVEESNTASNKITKKDYEEEIQELARNLVQAAVDIGCAESKEEIEAYVNNATHSTTDTHDWVNRYEHHQSILDFSDNPDAYVEDFSDEDVANLLKTAEPDKIVQKKAFAAFWKDLEQAAADEIKHQYES